MLAVYVNDNHGDWSAARPELVSTAMGGVKAGLVEPIIPQPRSPFVVEARHSMFYETNWSISCAQSDIGQLVLAGQVTEQCILYSALDAHVRHYEVVVPRTAWPTSTRTWLRRPSGGRRPISGPR